MRFFPDIRRFAWESRKTQKWNTTREQTASGYEVSNTSQLFPAWSINVSYPAITDAEANVLQGFAALVKGASETFLWLDPENYVETGQMLPAISATQYQAVMQLGDYVESVPYIDNVTVYVDGVVQNTGLYVADGIITFDTAPAGVVTADYRYYWKVKLDGDGIEIQKIFKDVNKCSFTLKGVR